MLPNWWIDPRDLGFPKQLWVCSQPELFEDGKMVLWNEDYARQIGLDNSAMEDLMAVFTSKSERSPGCLSLSLAYSGHQFGYYNERLGDGRAHLLAGIKASGKQYELQSKGSGVTRFSRGGDGRCPLRAAAREYIMGEAMASLGVRTTRSLCVLATGEGIARQRLEPGGIVLRVAESHLRVGSYQYAALLKDTSALARLIAFGLKKLGLETDGSLGDQAESLLAETIVRQAQLLSSWMVLGFIHGVMNTDNMSVIGETIDYGPCAMMGVYDPNTVYSSIDQHGRYRYSHQPQIALWNLTRFAEALLSVFDPQDKGIERLQSQLVRFQDLYQQFYYKAMLLKLGLDQPVDEEGIDLVAKLLQLMQVEKLDYTRTFHQLTKALGEKNPVDYLAEQGLEVLGVWVERWKGVLSSIGQSETLMKLVNPVLIPRNHHVEAVLDDVAEGSTQSFQAFLAALRKPFAESLLSVPYQDAPPDGDLGYKTFCGT